MVTWTLLLGGHLKLNPSDKLTPELFNKADKIMKDVGDYACNSWEIESIKDGKRLFDEIEEVVKRYREVMRRRILAELAKTPLNADVNEMIVSMF